MGRGWGRGWVDQARKGNGSAHQTQPPFSWPDLPAWLNLDLHQLQTGAGRRLSLLLLLWCVGTALYMMMATKHTSSIPFIPF